MYTVCAYNIGNTYTYIYIYTYIYTYMYTVWAYNIGNTYCTYIIYSIGHKEAPALQLFYERTKNILKMNKVGMLLPKKELIQVE